MSVVGSSGTMDDHAGGFVDHDPMVAAGYNIRDFHTEDSTSLKRVFLESVHKLFTGEPSFGVSSEVGAVKLLQRVRKTLCPSEYRVSEKHLPECWGAPGLRT